MTEPNKHAKTTLVEQRRNPDPSTRIKKRSDLLLIQMDLDKRTFQVVQEKVRFFLSAFSEFIDSLIMLCLCFRQRTYPKWVITWVRIISCCLKKLFIWWNSVPRPFLLMWKPASSYHWISCMHFCPYLEWHSSNIVPFDRWPRLLIEWESHQLSSKSF